MAHGAQECRLERVGAPQGLGLQRLAREAFLVDGHGQQRGHRRQKRRVRPAVGPPGGVQRDRADPAFACDQRRGVGVRAELGRRLAQLDPRVARSEGARRAGGDLVELAAHAAALEQRLRDLREQPRLGGAPPRARRELTHDGGGHDVHDEREPVARIADRERVRPEAGRRS